MPPTDPAPFLAAVIGASAGLVAIIGGLLVNRFIGLDSEQQGAQRILDDAISRRGLVKQRADQTAKALRDFEAHDFLDDDDVFDGIAQGKIKAAAIRPLGAPTDLTDDELQPYLDDLVAEYARVRATIDTRFPSAEDGSVDDWKDRLDAWDEYFRERFEPEASAWPALWEHAYVDVIKERLHDARHHERELRHADMASQGGHVGDPPVKTPYDPSADPAQPDKDEAGGGIFGSHYLLTTPSPAVRNFRPSDVHERIRLKEANARAQQQLEDVDHEVLRLRQDRDRIVRPDSQIWVALGVLSYPTVVGIALPAITLSQGPTAFTPWIRCQALLFVSVLLVLLGYMVYLAGRLHRRGRTASHDPVNGAAPTNRAS
ncbi:hypothetical protein [Prauserella muralis]|uniref:Uncharacterized protein n=1 Tax=Prauserella muralis TaxID=588067 RepID=A0A2V4ACB7_9PSEU|nr:hypothetical protein [Prauserella muralis]PXY16623.1 hypothetical protein BAY60_36140 [Prauserella muralis]TWE11127.1 hypothetical protein FHX69_7346 [Prauserella muralis]